MCVLVVMWFITFFFATLLRSVPISDNWKVVGNSTMNGYAMYTAAAALEMFLDVVTLILPLFVTWRLQMRSTQKWQISGIFLLGSFVCLAGILRLYYFVLHLNPTAEEEEDLTCTPLLADASIPLKS